MDHEEFARDLEESLGTYTTDDQDYGETDTDDEGSSGD